MFKCSGYQMTLKTVCGCRTVNVFRKTFQRDYPATGDAVTQNLVLVVVTQQLPVGGVGGSATADYLV